MENNFKKENQQKQFRIKGMHCKSCAELIEGKLKGLNGIKEAKVNYVQEQAFIRFDGERVSIQDIIKAIENAGYKASVAESQNNSFQREKVVKVRIDKSSFSTILIAVLLAFIIVNVAYTISLRNKLASLSDEADDEAVVENEDQTGGTLKEIQPSQGGTPSAQPSGARTSISADDDPTKGSESAPVTIIEFSEYQCPYCKRFFDQTLSLIEKNYIETGKVKYVFRDFPLSFHQYAQKAAEASECADEQGKFWQYHDKLFENQNALSVESLKQYAKDLGLNAAKFDSCLDSGAMASEVQKDFADGSEYGVSGTPAFFINGIKVVGAQPYSVFEEIIEQELNK